MKKILVILVILAMVSLTLPILAQREAEDFPYTPREVPSRREVAAPKEEAVITPPTPPKEERQEMAESGPATITLELKNMDIVEVLKLLASKGGMDVVISQNVRGRITLFLEDVPVWDAMEIVFETAGLAYTEHEGIMRILTGREYEQQFGRKFHDKREVKIILLKHALAADAVRELKQLKGRIGNVITDDRTNSVILLDTPQSIEIMEAALRELDVAVETKIFTLRYTPAKSLEETLKKVISKKGTLHVDDLTNKIIITDIPDVIRQADLLVAEYDKPVYLETKIFTLNYGKFDNVEEKVKNMLTKDVGIIASDERTNKIVVTDLPEKIIEITKVIEAYDEPSRQVLIEAKIVQVALKDEYKMGINWQLILNSVWIDRIFNTDTIDMTLSQVFSAITEIGLSDTAPFDNSSRAVDSEEEWHAGGRTLISGTLKEGHDFDAVINALKIAGKTNLLSSPRILALNNQEARIQVGTREAFITNTVVTGEQTTTAQNVTFIDVGIILTVTPTIGEDGFVTLNIKPEVSNVERVESGIPIVATQEAETTVMVKDGTTIIVGGLIEDQQYRTTDKIPILGSIPILGIPFRREHNKVQKSELVLFLTPTIVTGDLDLDTPSPEMMEYLESLKEEEEQAASDEDFSEEPVAAEPVEKKGKGRQQFTHR